MCDYLPKLGLNSLHVSERGPEIYSNTKDVFEFYSSEITAISTGHPSSIHSWTLRMYISTQNTGVQRIPWLSSRRGLTLNVWRIATRWPGCLLVKDLAIALVWGQSLIEVLIWERFIGFNRGVTVTCAFSSQFEPPLSCSLDVNFLQPCVEMCWGSIKGQWRWALMFSLICVWING